MNLLHMKYALEVAQTGSLNKAAERLLIGQPNLSRAVKELETSLGVRLFDRSAKGMTLTPEGEVFVQYAQSILHQVEAVEETLKSGCSVKKRFSIAVPRASYISQAFTAFSAYLTREEALEVFYKETNASHAIRHVLQEDYRLGILRYAEEYDQQYKTMLEEKGLVGEMVSTFVYGLLLHRDSPLACDPALSADKLADYTEIAHADPYVPSLPPAEVRKTELSDRVNRRIFVFERGSQFELLAQNPRTFMWASPVPQTLLDRYGLVQRYCADNRRRYKDVLIYRNDYRLSQLDNRFIEELVRVKRETFLSGGQPG